MKQMPIIVIISLIVFFNGCFLTDKMAYEKEKKLFENKITYLNNLLLADHISVQDNDNLSARVNFAADILYISTLSTPAKQEDDFNNIWMPKMIQELGKIAKKCNMKINMLIKSDLTNTNNNNKYNAYMMIMGKIHDDVQLIVIKYWPQAEFVDVYKRLMGITNNK